MLIRLLVEFRGAGWSRPAAPGEVWDLPPKMAVPLIRDGEAVPVTLAEIEQSQREER